MKNKNANFASDPIIWVWKKDSYKKSGILRENPSSF